MPFSNSWKRAWTRDAILALREGAFGVYGIFRGDECVYVGKGDLRDRLMDHLNGDNPGITKSKPSWWTAYNCETEDHATDLEKALILEHHPTCNKRVGWRHPVPVPSNRPLMRRK